MNTPTTQHPDDHPANEPDCWWANDRDADEPNALPDDEQGDEGEQS